MVAGGSSGEGTDRESMKGPNRVHSRLDESQWRLHVISETAEIKNIHMASMSLEFSTTALFMKLFTSYMHDFHIRFTKFTQQQLSQCVVTNLLSVSEVYCFNLFN